MELATLVIIAIYGFVEMALNKFTTRMICSTYVIYNTNIMKE